MDIYDNGKLFLNIIYIHLYKVRNIFFFCIRPKTGCVKTSDAKTVPVQMSLDIVDIISRFFVFFRIFNEFAEYRQRAIFFFFFIFLHDVLCRIFYNKYLYCKHDK